MSFIRDVAQEIRALKPRRKELRQLGLTFLIVLGLLGIWGISQSRSWGGWLCGLGGFFGLGGLIWPMGLRPVFFFWMTLAAVMGWVMGRILLIIVFYLLVTPISLILRCLGKDLLDLKLRDRASYWHRRPDKPYDPQQTEKMY